MSKYPETLDTRRDLKLLKWVWDFKSMCDKLFESWKQQVSERGHRPVPLVCLSSWAHSSDGPLLAWMLVCFVLCCLVLLVV